MKNKIFAKILLLVALLGSIHTQAQDPIRIDDEDTFAEQLVDTISFMNEYVKSPEQVAMDSLRNVPGRTELPDDLGFLSSSPEEATPDQKKMILSLYKLMHTHIKLNDNTYVFNATRADFADSGLPHIVYEYMLQLIADANFENKIYGYSSEKIAEQYRDEMHSLNRAIIQTEFLISKDVRMSDPNRIAVPAVLEWSYSEDEEVIFTPDQIDQRGIFRDISEEYIEEVDGYKALKISKEDAVSLGLQPEVYDYLKQLLDDMNYELDFKKRYYSDDLD